MMSAPITLCVSTLFSGVNVCLDPSMCDWKRHPSSVILRIFVRENTWNPPLSVRIGLSQFSNLCSPPTLRKVSRPGRR